MEQNSYVILVKLLPLLNAGALSVLIGLILKMRLANRQLTIQENSGLRKEFIDEMHALRDEVKELRGENDLLRKEIRELHGIIDGMRRENQAAQISGQRVITDQLNALPQGPNPNG